MGHYYIYNCGVHILKSGHITLSFYDPSIFTNFTKVHTKVVTSCHDLFHVNDVNKLSLSASFLSVIFLFVGL